MSSPGLALRHALKGERIIIAPGVFDGLSATIADRCGFQAVYFSGGAAARATGVPDLGLLSLTEVLGRLREVVDCVDVPVIADADTGFGNALNVMRTVHEFERLGVAALHLEDQVTPKRCGHYRGKALVSREQMTDKIRSAVEARRDPDLVLIARTDAIAVEGLDSALKRSRYYVDAGADAVFVEAPTDTAQIETIASTIDVPLVINMFAGGRTPTVPPAELERLGYRLMLVPSDLQRAAILAMQDVAAEILEHGTSGGLARQLASFDERDHLVGLERYEDLARRFGEDG